MGEKEALFECRDNRHAFGRSLLGVDLLLRLPPIPSRPLFRSFSVSGEGKTVVVPDVAEFELQRDDRRPQRFGSAQTENTAKMNKAIDFTVKSKGIEAKDIEDAELQHLITLPKL